MHRTPPFPVDLIIWDLDGTLADTLDDIRDSLNRSLAPLGIAPYPRGEVRDFIGRGIQNLIADAMRVEDPDDPRVREQVQVFRADYTGNLLNRTALYPGAREMLERFSDKAQAVISNKLQDMTRAVVEGLGVGRHFGEVIGQRGDYPIKPDPASTLAVMEGSGASPERTVFIGDSQTDHQTARNAGCLSVLVTFGMRPAEEIRALPADAHLDSLHELAELIC